MATSRRQPTELDTRRCAARSWADPPPAASAKVCFGSETADADERQNLDDYIRTIKTYVGLIVDLT